MWKIPVAALVCVGALAACGGQSESIKPLETVSTTQPPTTTTTKAAPTTRAPAPTTTTAAKPTTTTAPKPASLFVDFPAPGKALTETQVIALANAGATHTWRVAYEVAGPSGPLAVGNVISASAPPRASVRYGGSARYKLSGTRTVTCFMPDGAWECNADEPANDAGFFADGERDYKGKVREATRTADQTIAGRNALCLSAVVTERDGQLGRYAVCVDHLSGATLRMDSETADGNVSVKATGFGPATDADFTPPAPVK